MHELFVRWGRRVVRRRLWTGLDGVHVRGLAETRRLVAAEPVILAANHVCWWDGLVAAHLDATAGWDARILMGADGLETFPFFASFGAVGMAEGPAGRHTLRHLASFLDRPGRIVWVFPQGSQRPAHQRPLDLKPGLSLLARRSHARVVPVALDYRFRDGARPGAHLDFGAPLSAAGADGTARVTDALLAGLERLDGAGRGAPLLPGRPASQWPARLLGLAWTLAFGGARWQT